MSGEYEPSLASVIIPTYNRAHFITEAMDCVFSQKYRPIELLVVDDGSGDHTPAVVGSAGEKYARDCRFRMRCLRQANSGAAAARNLGLIESRGEFLQFLDSDDLLHPVKLERQIAELRRFETLDVVYSATANFQDQADWTSSPIAGFPVNQFIPACIDRSPWWTHGGTYRRSACVRIGPWAEELRIAEDWEYCVRFLTLGPEVAYVPGTLSLVRCHATGNLWATAATREGLESRLRAAERVEKALSAAHLLNAACMEPLGKRCVAIAYLAVRKGHDRVARRALARGLRWARSPACRAKLLGLRIVLGLPRSMRRFTSALLSSANRCAGLLANRTKTSPISRVHQPGERPI